jgi:hypothetical protein
LLRLSADHHLQGERAAILRFAPRRTLGHLCLGGRQVRRARRSLPRTTRQDQQRCDAQKGLRISISRNGPPDR